MRSSISVIVVFSFLLAACASIGTDFVRPESYPLGRTTYSKIVQTMGEPYGIAKMNVDGNHIDRINYYYSSISGDPCESDVIPQRTQVFFFHNDILVGQGFSSSFKSDCSRLDETKLSLIEKGKTTRAEVMEVFGRPQDSWIFPMNKGAHGEVLGYEQLRIRRGFSGKVESATKTLRISFDGQDRVVDVNYHAITK